MVAGLPTSAALTPDACRVFVGTLLVKTLNWMSYFDPPVRLEMVKVVALPVVEVHEVGQVESEDSFLRYS